MAEIVNLDTSPLSIHKKEQVAGRRPLEGSNVRNYEKMFNKPKINGVEVSGNKSLDDYGIGDEIDEKIKAHNEDPNAHQIMLASMNEIEQILNEE